MPAGHPGSWAVRADRLDNGRTSIQHLWVNLWPGTLSEWGRRPTRSVSLESGLCLYFGTIGGLAFPEPPFLICEMGVITVHPAWVLFRAQWGKEQGASENMPSASVLVSALHWARCGSSHQRNILQPGWSGTGETEGCGLSWVSVHLLVVLCNKLFPP